MNGGRRTRAAAAIEVAVEEKRPVVVKEGSAEEPMVVLDESHLESEVAKLRGRWELASVLNFLGVRSSWFLILREREREISKFDNVVMVIESGLCCSDFCLLIFW